MGLTPPAAGPPVANMTEADACAAARAATLSGLAVAPGAARGGGGDRRQRRAEGKLLAARFPSAAHAAAATDASGMAVGQGVHGAVGDLRRRL